MPVGLCLLLALAVCAVFGQTRHYQFVNYDDDIYVYENPAITQGLSWHGVVSAFTHIGPAEWLPMTALSRMLDWQFYGPNAGGHHLTNVLLHAANAILLFLLLRQMTGAMGRSAFVAAVFALHPLRVESVAWVTERKDVLSGLFFLLTLWAYVRYVQKSTVPAAASTFQRFTLHASRYYCLAVLFFALGLLAKTMLVTVPFVLLLLDYWPLKRSNAPTLQRFNASTLKRLLVEKIPFFALSALACVATFVVQQQGGAVRQLTAYPLTARLENVFVSYARYLGKTFWPAGLANPYPYVEHWPLVEVLLAAALLVGLSAAALRWRRRFPFAAVGWFWFVGMLVPVIGVVQVGNQSLADRYTYLPQIGLCILVAWGAVAVCGAWHWRRVALGSAAGLVLAGLLAASYLQTGYWKDSVSLWTHTLDCTAANDIAHHNLGNALTDRGNLDQAIEQYQLALKLDPASADIRIDFANALGKQGKMAEAIQYYEQALQLDPDSAKAHFDLGNVLAGQGKWAEAIQHYERAVELMPNQAAMHINLGNVLAQQGQWDEATEQYQRALQLDPNQPVAQMNLGNALLRRGKTTEAIQHLERAVELNPDYAEGQYNLANALNQQGYAAEAIRRYELALLLNPDFAQAHYFLAVVLAGQGKRAEAIPHFQQALDLATAQGNAALAQAAREQLGTR